MAYMYDLQDISYCAQRQPEWFTKAMFSGKIVDGGYVRIITNIKTKTKMNKLDITGNLWKKASVDCGWDPETTFKLSERELDVTTYKIQLEDCIERFEGTFLEQQMRAGANNTDIPDSLTDATLDLIAVESNSEIEKMIFNGDSANANEFDGFIKLLEDAADTIKVTGVALSTTNISSEFEKVYMAIPTRVLKARDKVKFYVSYRTEAIVRLSLSSLNSQVISAAFTVNGDKISYLGYEIVPAEGMADDMIIAASVDNLVMGTDLVSDFAEIELGRFAKPQDDKIFIKARMKMGVQIAYPDEVVLYAKS